MGITRSRTPRSYVSVQYRPLEPGSNSGSGAIGLSVARSMTRMACLVAVQGELTMPLVGHGWAVAGEEEFGCTPLNMSVNVRSYQQ